MNALAGRSVVVTGASGFIGGAVARRLRQAGAMVHCVSRRSEAAGGPWPGWWQVDLGDVEAVRRLLAEVRPDAIFHLAGITSAARNVESVLPVLRANLVTTVNLLVAAAEHPVRRLLFAGSLEEPEPEGDWPAASSPYAAAKFAAGLYARMFHALYDTPAVWLRLFMVYGPAQPDVRKLVPYVTCSLLRGEAPALSDGTRAVDWVYVDDVVDAFVAAAVADGVEGVTLDVGSGRLVTVREVALTLSRLIDPRIELRFGAQPERRLERIRAADVEATSARLGWRPRTALDDGLRQTVEWYRAHGPGSGN